MIYIKECLLRIISKIFDTQHKNSGLDNRDLKYTLRNDPEKTDCDKVRDILIRTGFFSDEEVIVAIELIEEKLSIGEKSTYKFIFAESGGAMLGYTCFGHIPLTKESYDLYWIAVDPSKQGYGIGRLLLEKSEDMIRELGGVHAYAETASRKQYTPTRRFYSSCGYKKAAYFPDFYTPGDGKVVYYKKLQSLQKM